MSSIESLRITLEEDAANDDLMVLRSTKNTSSLPEGSDPARFPVKLLRLTSKEDPARGDFTVQRSKKDPSSLPDGFRPALSPAERAVVVDLLRTIDQICTEHKITYFINHGTMLGSYRHHDIIPWDDDIDLGMPRVNQTFIKHVLNSSKPGYTWVWSANTQIRFIGPNSKVYNPSWGLRWPYVDIDFYSEDKTNVNFYHWKVYSYPKSIVFPLHRRPLGRLSLPAPKNAKVYISRTFDDYKECSVGLCHKTGRQYPKNRLPCEALGSVYPFVHRTTLGNHSVVETLKLGDRALYSLEIPGEPVEPSL